MNRLIVYFLAVVFVGCFADANAADPASSALSVKLQEEAREISSALIKRDALLSEVDRINKEITDRKKSLSELDKNTKALADAREKLDRLKSDASSDALAVQKLEDKVTDLGAAVQTVGSSDNLTAQIQALEDDVKRKTAQIALLLGTLTGQFSGEHSFKVWNSITFAILIGLVIFGFFTLAFIDANVRTAIFGGDSGIQFVALFSIIIAIILFGISGILEGKELSALLGGLSGYILGRTAGAKSERKLSESNPERDAKTVSAPK